MARKTLATPAEVRTWAMKETSLNVKVPAHGRLPKVIVAAFKERTGREIAPSERTLARNRARQSPQVSVDGRAAPAPDSYTNLETIAANLSYGKEPAWIVQGRERARARAQERMGRVEEGAIR